MPDAEAERLFASGLQALAEKDTLRALVLFEKALARDDRPIFSSYMAFCIAKERGQFQLAVTLCEKAIARDNQNPLHHLNLGKIYLLAGRTAEAVRAFREGLAKESNPQIIDELDKLEIRKPPVIPLLKRDNPLNKLIGIVLKKFGFR